MKIFGFWTFWVRPPHVWVVAPALGEPKVLRENTEKVVIFLKMRFFDVAGPPCVSVHGPLRYCTLLVYLKGAKAHFLGPEATPMGF